MEWLVSRDFQTGAGRIFVTTPPSPWYHQWRSAAPAGEDIQWYSWIRIYCDIFIKTKVIFYV